MLWETAEILVVAAKTNFVPNRVLGASPPEISPLQLESPYYTCPVAFGHCRLLNTYKTRITSGISDVCHTTLAHSVEHPFNCQSHPSNSQCKIYGTIRPRFHADFLNLDN